jgi:hypothetical protein
MSADRNPVHFHMRPSDIPLFITDEICELMTRLNAFLPPESQIHVFSDATLKPPGMPNGVAIESSPNHAVLLPALLRDPGCGFLTFQIEMHAPLAKRWQHTLGRKLNEFINYQLLASPNNLKDQSINDILSRSIKDIQDINVSHFQYTSFDIDLPSINIKPWHHEPILNDFRYLTNTVEIKAFIDADSSQNQLIGFIHTGSEIFPSLLTHLFYQRVVNASLAHVSAADIKAGIYGVALQSELGHEYFQWIKMAMNLAIYNRYRIYLLIKQFLETNLACTVSIMNDRIHAGALMLTDHQTDKFFSLRGVQNMGCATHFTHDDIGLLAGQKETIAYLFKVNNAHKPLLLAPHGTSYQVNPLERYDHQIITQDDYLSYSKKCFYNTKPDLWKSLSYHYNIISTMDYLTHEMDVLNASALKPLINIQAKSLIKRLKYMDNK